MSNEPIEPEIVVDEEDALDIRHPGVPITVEEIAALGPEEAQKLAKTREQVIQTIRKGSIRQTHPSDWVLYKDPKTGRVLAFLEDKGCQRLMDLWGVEITRITPPERQNSEDGQSYAYSIVGDGRSTITQRKVISETGTRYSTERFATEKPAGIERENAVKKAARANLEGRIVRNLAGLNGVPLEELILVSGDKDFERKASKGKGYGSQAERAGAQVQEHDEIEPRYQPKCSTCNGSMKHIPAGKTSTGKPYAAFWACENREHKGGIPHEQALAEAKRMKAEAEAASSPAEREPGAEG